MNEEKLFKNKCPHLLKEWDVEKNKDLKDVDLDTITYGSKKKVHWICPKNHKYETSIIHRTKINDTGCNKCFHGTLRIHDEDELNTVKNNHVANIITTQIGDATEKYVEDLLISMDCYKNITNLGNIGATSDISVTDDNNTYYIQVKTLSYEKNDSYYVSNLRKYSDNMLIVMINMERNRFALEFVNI